ncbi:MAG: ATP-dependent RNA helicase DbpA [Spirochaetales bacterium]|nr:ATP-dependent RNA helicase DbpA [Spirochaetales bacterium]
MKPFSHINLSQSMLANLDKLAYHTMTPVQEAALPPVLKGKDLLVQAKTGSGKTAAFGIGLLEQLKIESFQLQSLVLCPTRELALQVADELRRLARFKSHIKILTLTGGMNQHKQEQSLTHQPHIVVGTPGRIAKLLKRESLLVDNLTSFVLDEADRMLDMGFIEDIREIMDFLPDHRQNLCFSATFPEEIKALGRDFMNDPREITVDIFHGKEAIEQHFYKVPVEERGRAVVSLLGEYKPSSALIFCNTKDACRRLSEEMTSYGLSNLSLHGDLEQKERNEVLIRFSNGSCPYLVATDVAARGLDIGRMEAVINYNLPFEPETYIHRIGRTGRAGESGQAFSLVKEGEEFRIDRLRELMKRDITPEKLDTSQADSVKPVSPGMVTLKIAAGRKDKISAGHIVGAITGSGEIDGNDLGQIDRLDRASYVAVKKNRADLALRIMRESSIKGRRYKASLLGNSKPSGPSHT